MVPDTVARRASAGLAAPSGRLPARDGAGRLTAKARTTAALRLAVPIVALLVFPPALPAQESAEGRPDACSSEEFRQFDFWLGEWRVSDAAGNFAGTNTVRAVLDGCALQEDWKGARGSVGRSINIYDDRTRTWHQTWVDNSGLLLRLDGGPVDGSMVLQGSLRDREGRIRLHRITWTPAKDGTVRQHWQRADDDGKTWSTVFDGTYAPMADETER